MSHKDAFETAFGITLDDFLNEFKEEVLGQTKDCTVAKCGGGSVIGQFKMQDWVDPKVTTPNLVANFVDEQGRPVVISNLILAKQGADGSGANRETQYSLPGKFSINIFPGSYGFYFCEPGYPSGENTGACHAYETDWFNVSENQTANMTLQLPPYIDDANLKTPDIALKFTDENGNLLPNLRLQVCNVDTPVKVCSPQYQGKETDSNGVYQDSLRSGKYLVRFNWPNVGFAREWTYTFEIDNVNITENQVTNISYKFPAPNLIVKLTDLVGGPVPNHFLVLCTADHQLGNCANVIDSPNPWSGGSYTDKQGIFKAVVKPGTYFILTGKFPTVLPVPADYTFANINVASATETTTVEFQLK
jgi:hypothetical protein